MIKFPKLKILFLLSVSSFLFYLPMANAAQLNLVSQSQEIGLDDQFEAGLFLNTEDEDINAVEGKIIFPADILELKEIRDGNSIINLWIERPREQQTTGNKRQGEIIFSGIIPGGYQETKGFLLSVVFQAKTNGNGAIEIREAQVLRNDGEGTQVNLKISPFQFSILEEVPAVPPMIETVEDSEPPEEFKPEIVQSPDMFDGKWFLVFATQDKGSGVEGYAIHESTRKKEATQINTKDWIGAESPYVLKDQNLRSYIYVKAVDKVGNERIAVVEPRYPIRWYEQPLIWIIIILGVAIVYLVSKILWRKNTK